MSRYYKTLSEEKTTVLHLKGLCSNGKLPQGALSSGNQALKDALSSDNPITFFEAKEADAENEKMPEVKEITPSQRRASVTTKDAYISELVHKKPSGPGEAPGNSSAETGPKIQTSDKDN